MELEAILFVFLFPLELYGENFQRKWFLVGNKILAVRVEEPLSLPMELEAIRNVFLFPLES